MIWIVAGGVVFVIAIAICDLAQRQHAILRTFPIIGHFRYWLEAAGPELRQYIVTDNDEERPFSSDRDGRCTGEGACVSPEFDRQRVGNEFWIAERATAVEAGSRLHQPGGA